MKKVKRGKRNKDKVSLDCKGGDGIMANDFSGLIGFEEISYATLNKALTSLSRDKDQIMTKKTTEEICSIGTVTNELCEDAVKKIGSKKNKKNPRQRKKLKVALSKNGERKRSPVGKMMRNKAQKTNSKAEIKFDSTTNSDDDDAVLVTKSQINKKRKHKGKPIVGVPVKRVCYDKTEIAPHLLLGEEADVTAWRELFVPEQILRALAELGFEHPTEIQMLTLPAAIKGQRDVIGAAETGSGKTLAFGIPIVSGILELKEREKNVKEGELAFDIEEEFDIESVEELMEAESVRKLDEEMERREVGDLEDEENLENEEESEDAEEINEIESENEGFSIGCVRVIDNVNFDTLAKDKSYVEKLPTGKKLYALIVTPTRELAIQVKGHLDAILQHTSLCSAVVVGGMAPQKQERLLARSPEIVVGTPGRLWELIQQGDAHLAQVSEIRFLAIDETDRMVERGHFQELQSLLELINSNPNSLSTRQTFIFSATLTWVHKAPQRVLTKKNPQKMTSAMKIENLIKLVGMRTKPKIVDVTQKRGTAQSLTEGRISCGNDEKDYYLFYFLKQFPGRTLVFCNSVDCVRRLQNLFAILQCRPQSLHASMHQKQRLKSLENFTGNHQGLLLATDVAARGLDINGIQHVIHYQVPRTSETYIHRSGRTARASQEGLSVLLIDPSEAIKYKRLCTTLNRPVDLSPFPVDMDLMKQVKRRVNVARSIESASYRVRKLNAEGQWMQKMSSEAELIVDDDDFNEDELRSNVQGEANLHRELVSQRAMLAQLLSRPMVAAGFSGRYPTQTGMLLCPGEKETISSETTDGREGCKPGKKTNSKEGRKKSVNKSGEELGVMDSSKKISTDDNKESSKPVENKAVAIMKKEKETCRRLSGKIKVKILVPKVNRKKFKGFEKRKLKRQQEKEKMEKEEAKMK